MEEDEVNKRLTEKHLDVLKEADDALADAEKSLQDGRDRLQNAIKKYEERGRLRGPSNNF